MGLRWRQRVPFTRLTVGESDPLTSSGEDGNRTGRRRTRNGGGKRTPEGDGNRRKRGLNHRRVVGTTK